MLSVVLIQRVSEKGQICDGKKLAQVSLKYKLWYLSPSLKTRTTNLQHPGMQKLAFVGIFFLFVIFSFSLVFIDLLTISKTHL